MDMILFYLSSSFFSSNCKILQGNSNVRISDMAKFYPPTLKVAFITVKPPMNFQKESYDEHHAKLYRIFPGKDVLADAEK